MVRTDLPLISSSSSMIVSEAFIHGYDLIEHDPTRQMLLPSICNPPNTYFYHLQYPYNWKTSPPHWPNPGTLIWRHYLFQFGPRWGGPCARLSCRSSSLWLGCQLSRVVSASWIWSRVYWVESQNCWFSSQKSRNSALVRTRLLTSSPRCHCYGGHYLAN